MAVLTFSCRLRRVSKGENLRLDMAEARFQLHALEIEVKVLPWSADSALMRDLLYRLPRFSADFPVDVIVGEIAILGVCKNISETGMRGEFRQRLALGTEGLIRLNHPRQSMELRGKVVHYAQYQMGFHFVFQSEAERQKLCEFARAANVVGSSLRTAAMQPRGLRYLPLPIDRRHR